MGKCFGKCLGEVAGLGCGRRCFLRLEGEGFFKGVIFRMKFEW